MIMSVGVGWQVYELTGDALALGLVGLAQFLPMALLSWYAGDVADRFDRRAILGAAYLCDALVALGLIALTLSGAEEWAFYAILVLFGVARAFGGPAGAALLPRIATPEVLPKAIAWSSTTFQFAVIGGPALGGGLLILGADVAYAFSALLFAGALIATQFLTIRPSLDEGSQAETAWERVLEGVNFLRGKPVILGAISLDLFAVLFGGVTALLPIFAKDVLNVGPEGLGLLRSAPAAGAAVMSLWLGFRPLNRKVGAAMFSAVAVYGVFTLVFAFSQSFFLSLTCLAVLGAADMISVFIRQSLVQLGTPDQMRGRVSAVNLLFIGASNELGEFESGLMAAWLGAVNAAIVGGVGTIAVVVVWMALFPDLRRVDKIEQTTR
ncbi:MAG TPA: MFS transporter [Alphaproteobacteria bacterium]|nr:MFS transporter [Alphaproteobacteria bacterium]